MIYILILNDASFSMQSQQKGMAAVSAQQRQLIKGHGLPDQAKDSLYVDVMFSFLSQLVAATGFAVGHYLVTPKLLQFDS